MIIDYKSRSRFQVSAMTKGDKIFIEKGLSRVSSFVEHEMIQMNFMQITSLEN